MTDKQLLYLNLIQDDQWNPWLDMARAKMCRDKRMPLSFQFYLQGFESKKNQKRQRQRVKLLVDFDERRYTIEMLD